MSSDRCNPVNPTLPGCNANHLTTTVANCRKMPFAPITVLANTAPANQYRAPAPLAPLQNEVSVIHGCRVMLVDHMTLFTCLDYSYTQQSSSPFGKDSSVSAIFEVIDDCHPYHIGTVNSYPSIEIVDARCPLYCVDSASEWVGGRLSAKMLVKLLDLAKSLEELCRSKAMATLPGDDAVVVISSPDIVLAMFVAALASGRGIQSWLNLCEEHLPTMNGGMRAEYHHLVDAVEPLGSCLKLLRDRELSLSSDSGFEKLRANLLELIH